MKPQPVRSKALIPILERTVNALDEKNSPQNKEQSKQLSLLIHKMRTLIEKITNDPKTNPIKIRRALDILRNIEESQISEQERAAICEVIQSARADIEKLISNTGQNVDELSSDSLALYLARIAKYKPVEPKNEQEFYEKKSHLLQQLALEENAIEKYLLQFPELHEAYKTGTPLSKLSDQDPALKSLYEKYLATRNIKNRYVREFIYGHLQLVVDIARTIPIPRMELFDKIQVGNVALIKAADKFQPGKNKQFRDYAKYVIRRDIIRDASGSMRTIPVGSRKETSLRRMQRAEKELWALLGREPSSEEIAVVMNHEAERKREAREILKKAHPERKTISPLAIRKKAMKLKIPLTKALLEEEVEKLRKIEMLAKHAPAVEQKEVAKPKKIKTSSKKKQLTSTDVENLKEIRYQLQLKSLHDPLDNSDDSFGDILPAEAKPVDEDLDEKRRVQKLQKTFNQLIEDLSSDKLPEKERLSGRERAILILYYGLDGKNPETLEAIGEKHEVSIERVRQILARYILPKIKARIRGNEELQKIIAELTYGIVHINPP